MEARQGVPRRRRRAAAGNAAVGSPAGGPPGDGPQEQHEEEEEVVEGYWEGGRGGLGLSVFDSEEDAAVRVPGRAAAAEGRPAGRNTCCICLQPWAASGAHRVCCIPCGHVYGRSCLFRWSILSGHETAKCPLCGVQYKYNSIIDLYITTEHPWDDYHHEQASRQGAMEEEASREIMESALEVIARRDEVISQMKEERAQMIMSIAQAITQINEISARLVKNHDTVRLVGRALLVVAVVLLCKILLKLW